MRSIATRFFITVTWLCCVVATQANVTTYTFVSKEWKSVINATTCDGKKDGWICDQPAYEYSEGYTDAEGRIYSRGVSVKKSTTGAGATSVVDFEEVEKIEINFN